MPVPPTDLIGEDHNDGSGECEYLSANQTGLDIGVAIREKLTSARTHITSSTPSHFLIAIREYNLPAKATKTTTLKITFTTTIAGPCVAGSAYSGLGHCATTSKGGILMVRSEQPICLQRFPLSAPAHRSEAELVSCVPSSLVQRSCSQQSAARQASKRVFQKQNPNHKQERKLKPSRKYPPSTTSAVYV